MATTRQIVVFTVAILLGLKGAIGQLLLLVLLLYILTWTYMEKYIFIYER
jgi:hypothetical protein